MGLEEKKSDYCNEGEILSSKKFCEKVNFIIRNLGDIKYLLIIFQEN